MTEPEGSSGNFQQAFETPWGAGDTKCEVTGINPLGSESLQRSLNLP